MSDQLRALRDAARDSLARVDGDRAKASPPVADLLGEIRRHVFDESWSLRTLRRTAAEDLAGRFRTELGRSPARYLAGVRIETASRLLRDGDLPVGTVSLLVGYSDVAPFRRAFKSWFGLPPSEFRRLAQTAAAWTGGIGGDLLSFHFWDRLGRGGLDASQARCLVGWLQAAYRNPG